MEVRDFLNLALDTTQDDIIIFIVNDNRYITGRDVYLFLDNEVDSFNIEYMSTVTIDKKAKICLNISM